MKLSLECEKHSKLKEKYDSLEETFKSWMKFANDLQARVSQSHFPGVLVSLCLHFFFN